MMISRIRVLFFTLLTLFCVVGAIAQPRKVMNRPYLDYRKLHYGFLLGFHMQDMEVRNNGYITPEGEEWYTDVDNYNPGFTVGVLGELRLNNHFALRVSPTIHFGQKHLTFQRDTTQNMKSCYLSIPIDVKFAAPRYNNFRPYLIAGLSPTIDLTARKHGALRLKPFDCYIEVGMGCDIYLPFFKLNPELKFCFGLLDIIQKDRSDLIDNTLHKYTQSIDGGHSKMIVLTLYFE